MKVKRVLTNRWTQACLYGITIVLAVAISSIPVYAVVISAYLLGVADTLED